MGSNLRFVPIGFIWIYQKWISPFFLPSCRFYPSCSTYARQAFEKYGLFKGFGLSLLRLLKCHPFHPGGYDPLR
ncbi:MAG: membrane protein insertion efficiency factor YidD [Deltaproteobacteria bacterium]|nr:membrane protein insertion efficiency factor YidD [Deltaproteobacteria bacterium]MBW2017057.1 membrane protein insertion efficiency factor YidD [Deltaproteobacteria bacterium]MBW2127779.1 membrane protein insertion efficiency factor YidD [Deltaproteobacteria bacterium]MBW2304391.1 membrane protein insertion efficiency factor YidD [Deltaproteobacteria bacterium]